MSREPAAPLAIPSTIQYNRTVCGLLPQPTGKEVQFPMRLDKFLKVSRIIKRRTVANEACSGGRVSLNGKVAKPGAEVKVNDILEIRFGNRVGRYRIAEVKEVVRKEGAADMYEVLEEDAVTKAERGAEE